MAKGILGFLGFGKKEKPNLTQNYQAPPSASSAPLFGDLQSFARGRISGETAGFGADYMNKAANPITANMKARYQEETLPGINAELSKRGIARSAGPGLATDIINRSERANNRDIDEVMANFYQLNEAQKKSDISEGVRVGDQLNTQYLNQGNEQASQFNQAEAGNTARTVGQANTNNANALARQNQVLQAMGTLVGGPVGGAITKSFAPQTAQPATTAQTRQSGVGATTQKILNSSNLGGFTVEDLLYALQNGGF